MTSGTLESGQYLIVYEASGVAFNGGLTTLDVGHNTIDVTILDSEIAANNETNAAQFYITIDGNNSTIRSASGYYIGTESNANSLKTYSTESEIQNAINKGYIYNTISIVDGNAAIQSKNGPSLRFNANTGDNNFRFRYYKDNGQKAIQLYKYVADQQTSYNIYRTITAQNPHDQGGWLGNWTGCSSVGEATSATEYEVKALDGSEVSFEAGPNPGYMILPENISIKDADGHEVDWTINQDGKYSFFMPASDVTISADFTFYRPILRLAGHFNNHSNWIEGTAGPSFNYAYKDENNNVVDKYSIRAFFTGIDDDGYNDYFFITADGDAKHPTASGNWGVTNTDGTPVGLTWYGGGGNNFRIAPGVYDVEIAGDLSTIAFTKLEPAITFDPDAAEVEQGARVRAISTLTSIINAIQSADPVTAQGEVTVQVSTDNYTFSNNVTLSNVGDNQKVYGKASIGNIVVTSNKTYTVVAPNTGTQYQLITGTNTDDLKAGKKYIIVCDGSANWSSQTHTFTKAAGALDGKVLSDVNVTIDNNHIVDLANTSGVTEFTLGGNTTDGWTFAFSDGTKLTSTKVKELSAGDGTPANITFNGDNAIIDMGVGKLLYNPNQGDGRFSTYTSTALNQVMLFKQVEGTATEYSATPVISPESGEIVGLTQEVTINGTGTIYYSYSKSEGEQLNVEPNDPTFLTDPTTEWTEYTGPFTVGNAATAGQIVKIRAIAKDGTKEWSAVTPVTRYQFVAPARPVFSHREGAYDMPQSISLSTRTVGADIYYTTDASLSNSNAQIVEHGTKYTEPFTVSGQVTYYAVSVKNNAISSIVEAAYNCEAGATLEQIEENGVEGVTYTVSNDLQIVAISLGEAVIFARDLTTTYVECPEGATDFMVDVSTEVDKDYVWQKNNWVMLKFNVEAQQFKTLYENKENYIIQKETLTGVYTDNNNYTIEVTSTPTLVACGADNDYEPYEPNVYSPANFQVDEYGYQNGWIYAVDDEGNVSTEPTEVPYWFMTPQVMEVCKITWAMWYNEGAYANKPGFYMQNGTSGLKGGIAADFDYNNLTATPKNGTSYRFMGVIMKTGTGSKYEPQTGSERNDEFKVAAVNLNTNDQDPNNDQIITGVSEVKTGGEVMSVTYCDLAGRMSQKPFAGVNIIVTRYSDGTVKTTKAIK